MSHQTLPRASRRRAGEKPLFDHHDLENLLKNTRRTVERIERDQFPEDLDPEQPEDLAPEQPEDLALEQPEDTALDEDDDVIVVEMKPAEDARATSIKTEDGPPQPRLPYEEDDFLDDMEGMNYDCDVCGVPVHGDKYHCGACRVSFCEKDFHKHECSSSSSSSWRKRRREEINSCKHPEPKRPKIAIRTPGPPASLMPNGKVRTLPKILDFLQRFNKKDSPVIYDYDMISQSIEHYEHFSNRTRHEIRGLQLRLKDIELKLQRQQTKFQQETTIINCLTLMQRITAPPQHAFPALGYDPTSDDETDISLVD